MVSKFLSRMFLVLALVGVTGLPMKNALAADPENTLYLDLQYGRVVIEMRPDLAPTHVARIKELTREGFYDGVKFHRVIQDFMAQTGDPTGTGRGGSGRKLRAEFSNTPHLDKLGYTVWGRVIEGMEYVDLIKKGVGQSGMVPGEPDIIVKMQVAADAE